MTDQPSEMQAILDRLARLERQNRRLKRVGAVAVIASAAFVLMAQARPNRTIEAEQFILRNGSGKKRAGLISSPSGEPELVLWDTIGRDRASLHLTQDGPSLVLHDANGKSRLALTEFKGESHIWLTDQEEKARVQVTAWKDGGQLVISDKAEFRVTIGSTLLENPKTGEEHKTSAASVVMFGKEGKVIWQAP